MCNNRMVKTTKNKRTTRITENYKRKIAQFADDTDNASFLIAVTP